MGQLLMNNKNRVVVIIMPWIYIYKHKGTTYLFKYFYFCSIQLNTFGNAYEDF